MTLKLSKEDYFSNPAVSNTELTWVGQGLDVFKANKKFPKETTNSMILGSLLHTLFLEPEMFEEEYHEEPVKLDARTKLGKEQREELHLLCSTDNKVLVFSDDVERTRKMVNNIHQHEGYRSIQGARKKEIAILSEYRDISCKCKIDELIDDGKTISVIDLKTTGEKIGNPTSISFPFKESVMTYKYYKQLAFYREMLKTELKRQNSAKVVGFCYIVAVETFYPYHVEVFQLNEPLLECGLKEVQYELDIYKTFRQDTSIKLL